MILALDLATVTGWALLTAEGERIESGVWTLKAGDDEPRAARILRLRKRLREVWIRQQRGIELVCYEEPLPPARQSSKAQCFLAYGFASAVECIAVQWQLEVRAYPNDMIKTAAGVTRQRSRAVGKSAMIQRARIVFELDPGYEIDDNEADALFVGLAAVREGV